MIRQQKGLQSLWASRFLPACLGVDAGPPGQMDIHKGSPDHELISELLSEKWGLPHFPGLALWQRSGELCPTVARCTQKQIEAVRHILLQWPAATSTHQPD